MEWNGESGCRPKYDQRFFDNVPILNRIMASKRNLEMLPYKKKGLRQSDYIKDLESGGLSWILSGP